MNFLQSAASSPNITTHSSLALLVSGHEQQIFLPDLPSLGAGLSSAGGGAGRRGWASRSGRGRQPARGLPGPHGRPRAPLSRAVAGRAPVRPLTLVSRGPGLPTPLQGTMGGGKE